MFDEYNCVKDMLLGWIQQPWDGFASVMSTTVGWVSLSNENNYGVDILVRWIEL
jgi:hypothetical protein